MSNLTANGALLFFRLDAFQMIVSFKMLQLLSENEITGL